MNKKEAPIPEPYGNYEDKYHSKNFISKYLVSNFIENIERNLRLIHSTGVIRICEVGCGEGEILKLANSVFPGAEISAVDISKEVIEIAKRNCEGITIEFSVQNAEELNNFSDGYFDLVICCEVLEHLSDPQKGVKEVFRISSNYVLVSVPYEPIWRILNLIRGKYVRSFGNTPGHLNHWNIPEFRRLLTNPDFTIVEQNYPFPWQMILLNRKS